MSKRRGKGKEKVDAEAERIAAEEAAKLQAEKEQAILAKLLAEEADGE
jgi:hypothetical protein